MNKMIFIVLAAAFAAAIILLSTFIGTETGPESKFRIKADQNTILFAVTPWGDPKQVKSAYAPLLKYLSERTGKEFQLLVMEDYDVATDNIVDGNIDISVISPIPYIKAKEREPAIQYISTILRERGKGKLGTTFKGYLIALKQRYNGWMFDDFLKAPKKYNLGFISKASASGFAYPMAMMKKRGIDPFKAFKSVTIFENHPAMIDALAAGKIDVGATWEYSLEQARAKHGDVFAVVYTTEDIPSIAWVASKNVSPLFVEKIRHIQDEISASSDLKEKLLRETPDKGWGAVDLKIYDKVEEVIAYVGEFK